VIVTMIVVIMIVLVSDALTLRVRQTAAQDWS
jgi:hypothetical protein